MAYKSTKGYDFNDHTGEILGACVEVHKILGAGFPEVFYQRALALEFAARDFEYAREVNIEVYYKGHKLGTRRVDFIVWDVMLEIKAKAAFEPQDFIQTLSYLRASKFKTGLLVNFGAEKIQIKRFKN